MSNIQGIDKGMAILQDRALTNELDYLFVMDCLKEYANPRAKLSQLIKSGGLVHIKKGLYLLGPRFKKKPYCLELLANLIYGPSYVSLERALQIHGLIPEHVEAITSVTLKRTKDFKTPVGQFLYQHCHSAHYSVGITIKQYSEYESALIATPEKAVTDILTLRRGKITSMREIEQILLEDLRMEEEDLFKLDLQLVRLIQKTIPHSAIFFFEKWLSKHSAGNSLI